MSDEIFSHDFKEIFEQYVQGLKAHPEGELRGLYPFHDDHHPSFTANRHTGCWKCFGCDAHDNAEQFAERVAESPASGGKQRREGTIVATYDYRDEQGTLLYEVVRFLPKDFAQRRPDGNGG